MFSLEILYILKKITLKKRQRNITGQAGSSRHGIVYDNFGSGALRAEPIGSSASGYDTGNRSIKIIINSSYVVPTSSKNQIDNIALLGCIYYL